MEKELLRLKKMVKQLQEENRILKDIAYHDHLTGLQNRRALSELDIEGTNGTVVMMDIDYFKLFNDKYGHNKGDELLKLISEILQERIRIGDLCIRWGGEEFLLFYRNCDVKDALDKLRSVSIQLHFNSLYKFTSSVTASYGVTKYHEGLELKDCIEKADIALYKSKELGKNTITVYEEGMSRVRR